MSFLTAKLMRSGLTQLDHLLPKPVTLIIGGGGAMILAYSFPLSTSDIDAVPQGLSIEELSPLIEKVSKQLGIPADWLNPWFGSFTYVLPEDYGQRLVKVFDGEKLKAFALGKEDLLLMKCFAHRKKDLSHARALVRAGAQTNIVYRRMEELAGKKIPGVDAAEDFLDEVLSLEET